MVCWGEGASKIDKVLNYDPGLDEFMPRMNKSMTTTIIQQQSQNKIRNGWLRFFHFALHAGQKQAKQSSQPATKRGNHWLRTFYAHSQIVEYISHPLSVMFTASFHLLSDDDYGMVVVGPSQNYMFWTAVLFREAYSSIIYVLFFPPSHRTQLTMPHVLIREVGRCFIFSDGKYADM